VRVRINLVDADPDGDRHATARTKRSVSVAMLRRWPVDMSAVPRPLCRLQQGSDCVKQFQRGDCVAVRQAVEISVMASVYAPTKARASLWLRHSVHYSTRTSTAARTQGRRPVRPRRLTSKPDGRTVPTTRVIRRGVGSHDEARYFGRRILMYTTRLRRHSGRVKNRLPG
jgi:hypothetical protein